jgi:hypothetical protein
MISAMVQLVSEFLCSVCEGREQCKGGGPIGSNGHAKWSEHMADFRARHKASCGSEAQAIFLGRDVEASSVTQCVRSAHTVQHQCR